MVRSSRRAFLATALGAVVLPSGAAADGMPADGIQSRSPPDFTVMDIDAGSEGGVARRFTLFVPNHLGKDERVPLLVLLHGLGETYDTTSGVYAWVEHYGLGTAYARLRRPPLARTSRVQSLFTDERLARINAALAAQPFRGMAVACPYTPNVQKLPSPATALDAYAAWIADVVLPRARKEAPVIPDAAHTALDGVSLGGYVGIEVFLRRPDAFAAWGGVQSALNPVRLPSYAERLAGALGKAPRTSIHIETTEADPFRDVNTQLAALLSKKGVPCDFVVLPGPHDQVFLRESGTVEMLLWHDRRLR